MTFSEHAFDPAVHSPTWDSGSEAATRSQTAIRNSDDQMLKTAPLSPNWLRRGAIRVWTDESLPAEPRTSSAWESKSTKTVRPAWVTTAIAAPTVAVPTPPQVPYTTTVGTRRFDPVAHEPASYKGGRNAQERSRTRPASGRTPPRPERPLTADGAALRSGGRGPFHAPQVVGPLQEPEQLSKLREAPDDASATSGDELLERT